MIRPMWIVSLAVVALGLSSCGKKANNAKGDGIVNADQTGCVQGVVRNGLTGERLGIKTDEATGEGIYLIVRNKLIPATTLVPADEETRTHLKGEYYACGFPLNESFPVVVKQDGFQAAEGTVYVNSHLRQATPSSEVEDHKRTHPTVIGNIDLFPMGTESQDMAFKVYFRNKTIENAEVQLTSTSTHELATPINGSSAHSFSMSTPIRTQRISVKTDVNGIALFKADQLVIGAKYNYAIIPPAGGLDAELKRGDVTIGLRMAASEGTGVNLRTIATKPFEISVALDRAMKAPALVQSSLTEYGYDANGRIELVFDTEIELTPASEEAISASLVGNVKASVKDPGAKGSVKHIVEGRRLILEPIWDTRPDRDEESDVTVRFNNISVRPVNETSANMILKVTASDLSVRIFDRI